MKRAFEREDKQLAEVNEEFKPIAWCRRGQSTQEDKNWESHNVYVNVGPDNLPTEVRKCLEIYLTDALNEIAEEEKLPDE